ncbi:reverse transcriptase domain-containing protein [Tanacetum coccineum]
MALFTSLVAAKSGNLRATLVVAKSRNLEGEDMLSSSHDSNLYTISISDMAASSPICLMSKATSTKSWLWHRILSHLNFDIINYLTKQDLVDRILKFKYDKDHLCLAYEQGKSKKAILKPKLVPNTHSNLEMIHMDLCGSMRVESINGKRYILTLDAYTVQFEPRDECPENPREIYSPILDITHFPFFLNFLKTYDLMAIHDVQPMWAAECVVALTPGPAITIPATVNEFAIKCNHLTLVKGNRFDGRIKTGPYKLIHEFLGVCDMFKYGATENEVVRLMMLPLSLTAEAKTWLDELNE